MRVRSAKIRARAAQQPPPQPVLDLGADPDRDGLTNAYDLDDDNDGVLDMSDPDSGNAALSAVTDRGIDAALASSRRSARSSRQAAAGRGSIPRRRSTSATRRPSFVTTPAITSLSGQPISYPIGPTDPGTGNGHEIQLASPVVTFTFYRPQRPAIPGAEAARSRIPARRWRRPRTASTRA
jgi:hypothetical protein